MKDQYPPNEGQDSAGDARPNDDARRSGVGVDEIELKTGEIAAGEPSSGEDKAAVLNDRILRLAAELENTRRRAERERADAGRYAIAGFARDLLGVVDALERALAHAPTEREAGVADALWSVIEGVRLSEASMISVLERHGVRRIFPKGEKFDPNLHQAVAQAPGEAPAGHVLDVAQAGYTIGERTLRAAMVVVSTGPASGEPVSKPGAHVDTSA
jgi:molecular chaperone GrpE